MEVPPPHFREESAMPLPPEPMQHGKNPRVARRRWFRLIALVIFILVLVGFVYYFIKYEQLKNDPAATARAAATKAVKELSQVMVVPDDSNPVLATVSDKDKLKGQPFFEDAENGDEVIIFPASMKAVLYRPATHKIVDIAPLASGTGTAAAVSAAAPMTPTTPAPTEKAPVKSDKSDIATSSDHSS